MMRVADAIIRCRSVRAATPGPTMTKPALTLAEARSTADWHLARDLVAEYVAALHVDLSFQAIDVELARLPDEYGPPAGAFLIAWLDREPAGCVALRPLAEGDCEMKRLYVRPGARGSGAGRALAEAVIDLARGRGYQRMRLDTLADMNAAQALYRSLGFTGIPAYRFNPVPGTLYMERNLG